MSVYLTGSLSLTKKFETAFITDGFDNWKKAVEKFERHETSEYHKEAVFKFSRTSDQTIRVQLSTTAAKTQANNRRMLLKVLHSLRFLLRQGLAICGHKENEGNLIQLLKMQSHNCPDLEHWLETHNYLSHNIVDEMISLLGTTLLRSLLSKIHTTIWFSIIADETRDVSNHEQLTLCIRWVDDDYSVHEDFIGMVHVHSTTSDAITSTIKDILVRCILNIGQCRGQAYDGAANMMGHLKGVATQILKEEPNAIPVHCLAHRLNLCLQDAAKHCQPVRNALTICMELSQLILYSPKRTQVFQQCKLELAIGGGGLKPLCPTRWTVCTAAISAVLKNFIAIKYWRNML